MVTKEMNEYTIHFGGLAGHSSKPHKGVNAIEYASRYINKLLEIRQRVNQESP
jgi:acetylornithine deacetylase